MKKLLATLSTSAILAASVTTMASADGSIWPFDVVNAADGKNETVSYSGLEKAEKQWHICVLFPHMKDSYWVGVNYGIVDQARNLGVKATILEAGGYTEAAKQVSQYNDCLALGVDAIVIGAISEAGLAKSMAEGKAKGVVQVGVINPMSDVADARIFANYDDAAEAGAKFLVEKAGGNAMRMVHFPGPQGSGWAEASTEGVERALEGSSIELLEAKYGDTGKSIQLKLVEDALQAYDGVNIVYGTAVTAEVAAQALEEAGIDDAQIAAYYSNEGMVDLVKSGVVTATVTESPVMEARIAMDMAVRILEGKDHMVHLFPSMTVVTKENIDGLDLSRSFAPADWNPVYSVE
ncbi:TMAO reductase system periplasmic protein TorT [Aliiroseovarius subalbicans]|uniref:TMAO reductase system periplasmic protein TorT n=1 Tax=Aliiroseovarius subalbicans TaxID=2925840 RepID=UPI001F57C4EA|nr:TMAO reductase system periplasmic protein TorT [Aliiroseovarius subalbicans]MCI2400946.1 TMAO reductase system periplasmic protein TorT [Aliiroseovarius subalbicans]